MSNKPDFFKRNTLFSSIMLLVILEVLAHALWLVGIIPDNNTGGAIVYSGVPLLWLITTGFLVGRKFLP